MTESKIVKVRPTTPMIALTWMIGARCNYDCMYCPAEAHDKTSPHPDLQQLTQAWNNFYQKTQQIGLPYKISFTGGEVTANRSFLPLVEYLRSGNYEIGQLLITTNGSASTRYYLRLAELVDSISFSTHSEFFDETEFFEKVREVNAVMPRPQKSVHVNIMDEWWNQSRTPLYKSWLDHYGISNSINVLDHSQQTRTYPLKQGRLNLDPV